MDKQIKYETIFESFNNYNIYKYFIDQFLKNIITDYENENIIYTELSENHSKYYILLLHKKNDNIDIIKNNVVNSLHNAIYESFEYTIHKCDIRNFITIKEGIELDTKKISTIILDLL